MSIAVAARIMITERDGDSGAVPFLAEVAIATFLAAVEGLVALLGVREEVLLSLVELELSLLTAVAVIEILNISLVFSKALNRVSSPDNPIAARIHAIGASVSMSLTMTPAKYHDNVP